MKQWRTAIALAALVRPRGPDLMRRGLPFVVVAIFAVPDAVALMRSRMRQADRATCTLAEP